MKESLLYGWVAAWKAEQLKLKGSRIGLLIFVVGLAFPVLYFVVSLIAKMIDLPVQTEQLEYSYFEEEFISSVPAFGSFFYPLGLILLMTRLIAIEHKSDTWKLVETQPVSRFSFWSVKFSMGILLSAAIVLLNMIFSLIFFGISAFINDPGESASYAIPFGFLGQLFVRLWLSGFGILIVQIALATLIRNTIWPVVIGVIAMIVMNIVSQNNWILSSTWPYALPSYTAAYPSGSEVGFWLLPAESQGLIWLLLIPFAFYLYDYRLRLKAIFNNRARLASVVLSMAGIALLTWWIQKPAQLPLVEDGTVIAGKIDGKDLPDSVEIFTLPLEFSLKKVPIEPDGSFYAKVALMGGAEQLVVRAGVKFATQVYAGKGDSLFLNWTIGNKPGLQKVKLRGNAIATNQYLTQQNRSWSLLRFQLDNSQELASPESFYKELFKEWEKKNKTPLQFRTADGLGLSSNMQAIQQKLIAAEYISMAVFEYPNKKQVSIKDSAMVRAMKLLQPMFDQVQLFDSSLAGWQVYHDYVYNWLIKDALPTQNKDSIYRTALLEQPSGKMRDRLLYDFLDKKIQQARDSVSRESAMIDAFAISDTRMVGALVNKIRVINRLRRGQVAPVFTAHTKSGDTTSLASLKGKYVVIDVWATWCGPCKQQSPIFENISYKYKNDQIVFLALSVDEDRMAWQNYQKNIYSEVLHWRASDWQGFNASYGVQSIPRFILIDPAGKLVNAALPFPNDPNFEIILRQALSLKAEEG